MNKKMRELLAKIEAKQALAKGYTEEGENKDIEKAKAILNEIKALKEEYEVEKELFENEKEANKINEEEAKEVIETIENQREGQKENSTKAFATAVKTMVNKVMNEGAPESGGYTVPEDIVTKIEKLRETEESLRDEIRIKKVKTKSGKETYKTRSQATGFGAIEEGGKIPKAGSPKYSKLSWQVTKYGGYMPVTNELLEDSDEDIENDMTEWLASESNATWNKLILAIVAKKEQTNLVDLNGIKKALNVTLGSTFKSISKIITNDDGLNYLDTLTDKNGRPLLNPDPTDSAKLRLRAGATVVPIKVYSNDTIPTTDGKVPFIIGSLKEGIKGFDRKQLTLMASQTAVVGSGDDALNAFEEDLTLIRGIEREDVEMRDEKAFVNGYIKVATSEQESQSKEEQETV